MQTNDRRRKARTCELCGREDADVSVQEVPIGDFMVRRRVCPTCRKAANEISHAAGSQDTPDAILRRQAEQRKAEREVRAHQQELAKKKAEARQEYLRNYDVARRAKKIAAKQRTHKLGYLAGYRKRPEQVEKRAEYHKSDEAKAQRRSYLRGPQARLREKERNQRRRSDPAYKERERAQQAAHKREQRGRTG